MKRPAMWFYPEDWLHDAALRSCSPAARSLWLDMICLMHQATPYGHLLVNQKVIHEDKLEVMLGGYPGGVKSLLVELEDAGVFSRNEGGCIYSRRMVRDEEIRLIRRECGSKGGNPRLKQRTPRATHLVNQKVIHGVNTEELKIEDLNTGRLRNEIWDALSEVTNVKPETKTERKLFGKLCRELKEAGATPDAIQQRASNYRRKWPSIDLTPTSLVKHWGELAVSVITAEDRRRKDAEDRMLLERAENARIMAELKAEKEARLQR